jgi:hypothetical protein
MQFQNDFISMFEHCLQFLLALFCDSFDRHIIRVRFLIIKESGDEPQIMNHYRTINWKRRKGIGRGLI